LDAAGVDIQCAFEDGAGAGEFVLGDLLTWIEYDMRWEELVRVKEEGRGYGPPSWRIEAILFSFERYVSIL
jgi:hypothetical protein